MIPAMTFQGGSAWAMVREISEGYILVTSRTFMRMTPRDVQTFSRELERRVREIRGEQPSLDDISAVQHRQRRLQRLKGAQVVLRNVRAKRKI